eukprot:gene1241-1727_t
MAAVDTALKEASAVALPGLGRALMSAGKLTQKSAEDIYKKCRSPSLHVYRELPQLPAANSSRCAIWQSLPATQNLLCQVSTTACSVRRRRLACHAISHANKPWK